MLHVLQFPGGTLNLLHCFCSGMNRDLADGSSPTEGSVGLIRTFSCPCNTQQVGKAWDPVLVSV